MQSVLAFLKTPRGRVASFAVLLCVLVVVYIGLILMADAVSSNIAFRGTMLPELLEWSYQGIELLTLFVSYTCILYAMFEGTLRRGGVLIGVYAAFAVLRFAVLLLMGFIGFWAVVANLLPELLQLLIVVLICHRSLVAFDRVWHVMHQGARSLEHSIDRRAMVYPQKKQPISKDALLRAARGSAVCVIVIRVLGRLVYDFTIGPPADLIDALWMLGYYSADVLIGVGGYYLMKWMMFLFGKKIVV